MNTFGIDDVVEEVTRQLHAVNGSGTNAKGGVYFRWRLDNGHSLSIWVADVDVNRYTRQELAGHIAFELSRKRE
jgi:hypothetical protein